MKKSSFSRFAFGTALFGAIYFPAVFASTVLDANEIDGPFGVFDWASAHSETLFRFGNFIVSPVGIAASFYWDFASQELGARPLATRF